MTRIVRRLTIKRRIFIYLMASTLLVVLISIFLSQHIINREFHEIAINDINQKLLIVQRSINSEIKRLASINSDWGSWDDTYQFIVDKNKQYQQANLIPSSFITLDLCNIIYFDLKQNVVYAGAYDSIQNTVNNVDANSINKIKKKLFDDEHRLDLIKGGITMINNQPYIVTAESILTSQHHGPLRGWLCMVRPLDLQPLIRLTGISLWIGVETYSDSTKRSETADLSSNFVMIKGDSIYADYCFMDLLSNDQIITLRLMAINQTARQGTRTVFYIVAVVIIFALILFFLSLLGTNLLILKPLSHISEQLQTIDLNKISQKISLFKASEEFYRFTSDINNMLEVIDRQKRQILENEQQYRDLVEKAEVGILVDDIDGNIVYFNDKASQLFGYDSTEFKKIPLEKYIHPDDLKTIRQYHRRRLAGEEVPARYEFRGLHKNGQVLDYEVNVVGLEKDGKMIGTRNYIYNITERKKLERSLHIESVTDGLTGLLNQRGFYAQAQHQINLARRTKKGFYLFYCDLNNLKLINDKFGHVTGDILLKNTAQILLSSFRKSDYIARVGGDEFIILTPEAVPESINIMVSRLNNNIVEYNKKEKQSPISLSIGYAYFQPDAPRSLEELIKIADEMMYREKEKLKKKNENDRRAD